MYLSVARNLCSKKVNRVCVFNSIKSNRFITTSSWAAESLKEAGEKLEKSDAQPLIEVSSNMFSSPSPKVQKLADEVLELNMVEVNQFIKSIQKKLGLNDEMMMFGGGGGGGGSSAAVEAAAPAEPVKEKTAFDIKLTVVDAKAKIKIIKEIRTITGLGLKEAKDLVEKAPVMVKEGLKKEEAESFKKILIEAGAQVEIL